MMAIEWSDDSLFCYTLLTQSVAVAVGVPLAGKYLTYINLLL